MAMQAILLSRQNAKTDELFDGYPVLEICTIEGSERPARPLLVETMG
jgi:hypothetical protein